MDLLDLSMPSDGHDNSLLQNDGAGDGGEDGNEISLFSDNSTTVLVKNLSTYTNEDEVRG